MSEMTALEIKRRDKLQEEEVAQEKLDALIPKPVGYRVLIALPNNCLLYTSPSPRDRQKSRMPSSA